MADTMGIDLGVMIMMGVLVGLPTAAVGLLVCRAMNRVFDIPMRPYSGEAEPDPLADEELPPLWLSVLPILLPVILICTNTITETFLSESTIAAMKDRQLRAIFEAAFVYDGIMIRVDILERLDHGQWNLIEVKSSTSVKDVHVPDVAVQLRVLEGSGLKVQRAGILYLNNQYIYDGSRLELENLFSFSDLMEEAAELQESVGLLLSEMKDTLSSASQPEILPSRHCQSPYLCEFWEHCTAEMPDYWIMHLYGISKTDMDQLGALGVEDIRDIPGSFPLTRLQSRVRECVINREEYLSPQLADELNEVDYPIHFLDFETVAPAIPRYPGTRPSRCYPFNGQITSSMKMAL